MQQQPESTLPPYPEPPEATPPTVDPARWEDFEGFRETFLAHLTDLRYNEAFRAFANRLYELVLEVPAVPRQPPAEPWLAKRIRGALGDLRFLQGFLAAIGEERRHVSMSPENEALCRAMGRMSRKLEKIAAEVESGLGGAA